LVKSTCFAKCTRKLTPNPPKKKKKKEKEKKGGLKSSLLSSFANWVVFLFWVAKKVNSRSWVACKISKFWAFQECQLGKIVEQMALKTLHTKISILSLFEVCVLITIYKTQPL